jgi:uncharacterized phage infection (PIP) family protein YhgE
MRNEAADFREKARAIAEEGKAVAADALRLLKEIRTATESTKKSIQKTAKLRELTDKLLAAPDSGPGGRPGGRPGGNKGGRPGGNKGSRGGGNKPGRQPSGGNDKLKEKAKTLLEETAETEREISGAKTTFATIRENIADIKTRAKKTKEDAASLRASRERFASSLEKNRRRRKLDPQWAQLKDVSAKIEEHEKNITENSKQIEEALAGRMLESRDKTRNLIERIEEISEQIDENSGKIGDTLKELEGIRRDLNSIINN